MCITTVISTVLLWLLFLRMAILLQFDFVNPCQINGEGGEVAFISPKAASRSTLENSEVKMLSVMRSKVHIALCTTQENPSVSSGAV